MKKTFKILEKTIYTIFILVAVLLVWSVLPIKGAPKILAVLSGSMEPEIHTGSVVVIKPLSTSSGQATAYKAGDIITFGKDTKKDVPTTHRIVLSRVQDGVAVFTTKGDANDSNDSAEIKQSDIHGKVLFSVPLLGYVVDFVRQPIGLVLIIVLPAIFIVYDEVKKIMREVSRLRPKATASQEKIKEKKENV